MTYKACRSESYMAKSGLHTRCESGRPVSRYGGRLITDASLKKDIFWKNERHAMHHCCAEPADRELDGRDGQGVSLPFEGVRHDTGAFESESVDVNDTLPPTPGRGELDRRRSVTQYGITWTFEEKVPVGRFVNGDHYVVGPVTIVAIEPRPLLGEEVPEPERDEREKRWRKDDGRFIRNGSMLNPPARQEVAYDSGIRNWFRPDLVAVPPIRMKPDDSLVSTISLKAGEESSFPYHGSGHLRGRDDNSPVKTAAVLTCLAKPAPPDAFRPSYGDRSCRTYLARDLRRDLLFRLPRPADGITLETGPSDLAFWVRVFQRPWVSTGFFGFEQPVENMPYYEQWIGQATSVAGLMLMLDFPPGQKERLLVNVVQVGVDYWGLVRGGHPGWQGWGGHGSGRKFPIVFAGLLLGDEEMASPTQAFPKVEFGEDNQTIYGKGWTGATALFAGHSGIQSATGKPERPKWGPYEHLHPSAWSRDQFQSEVYRRANTSSSWVGQALVMCMLRAEEHWHHDAFFDYVDRWMTEPNDAAHRAVIAEQARRADYAIRLDEHAWWTHQGNTWEPFVRAMLDRYRDNLPAREVPASVTLPKRSEVKALPSGEAPAAEPPAGR